MSMSRYLAGANPTKVVSAKANAHPKFPKVDACTTATLAFPTPGESTTEASTEVSTDGLTASLLASYRLPPVLGFLPACPKMSLRVSGTRGTATVLNAFPAPWIRHTLTVVIKRKGWLPSRKRTEKHHGKVQCTTWVASHCVHLSNFDYVCADTIISLRHSLTKCVVEHPSIGTVPRTRLLPWSGLKPSTKKSVVDSSLFGWAITIVYCRQGWDHVLHQLPRCQCK